MPKKLPLVYWVAIAISLLGYAFIAYGLQRTETASLLLTYGVVFAAYLYLVYKMEVVSIRQIIYMGIAFGLVFLVAIPTLSDDFYRFIWDGRLWFNGINPFAELPDFYINTPGSAPTGITPELFKLLNSPTHYTVYPPIPQFINWIAAWLASDSFWLSGVIMRVFQLLAELGTLMLFPSVLKAFKLPAKNMIWYALNPLIIIELTGNLHHEALMVFFIMLFLAHYKKGNFGFAAFALAMSVAAKLIPLMFLPYILLVIPKNRRLHFIGVFTLSILISFAPLLDASFFRGIENSLLLYYQKFEFNAGIYYAFRQIGYWIKGYNMITLIGKWMAVTTIIGVLGLSWWGYRHQKSMPLVLLWISTLFAMFSLILHPWYIGLVILFGSFTTYRFGVLWSLLIMGTYAGYSTIGFTEVMPLVAVEFIAVLTMLIFEIKKRNTSTLIA